MPLTWTALSVLIPRLKSQPSSAERSKTLRDTANKRKEMHLSNLIGSKVKVFMEKQNRGHTNQFAPVKFIEEEIKHGQTVDALIVDADKECAYALAV